MHEEFSDPPIVAFKSKFMGVHVDQLSFDRILPVVICANSHERTSFRILRKRLSFPNWFRSGCRRNLERFVFGHWQRASMSKSAHAHHPCRDSFVRFQFKSKSISPIGYEPQRMVDREVSDSCCRSGDEFPSI